MRHGLAAWPAWKQTDADRALTAEGTRQIQALGAALVLRGLAPTLILHSPLTRAFETALLLGESLGCEDRVRPDGRLSPGLNAATLSALLQTHAALESLMLVGHNPDMAELIHHLTGAVAQVKEGTLACIKLDQPEREPRGLLLWLVRPDLFEG